jgi:hypothetical protein
MVMPGIEPADSIKQIESQSIRSTGYAILYSPQLRISNQGIAANDGCHCTMEDANACPIANGVLLDSRSKVATFACKFSSASIDRTIGASESTDPFDPWPTQQTDTGPGSDCPGLDRRRSEPVEPFQARSAALASDGLPGPATAAFARAIEHALRMLARPQELLTSPLHGYAVFAAVDTGNPVASIRQLVSETIESLVEEPGTAALGRILRLAYVGAPDSRSLLASRLHIGESTLRRRLKLARESLVATLWARELEARRARTSGDC